MGIEKTHGRNYDLSRLLNAIDAGKIVLPEFQRDFLWDAPAVKQLIATCLNGWPVGSLLLLPGKSRIFFKTRLFESATTTASSIDLVVLDGQQRLTSLFQALRGRGDFRYGIKYQLLRNDQSIEQLEDAIFSLPVARWLKKYPDSSAEFADGVIPVTALSDAGSFYGWRDKAVPAAAEGVRSDLADLYVDQLSGLDRYEVPAVVIDDDVHPEAIARIFERVNRLGQPLSTFDLMVAKSFAEDFNLRDEWDKVQEDDPLLSNFLGGDGLPILSVIALNIRASVRQNDVLALTGASVRDYWGPAAKALGEAIRFLQRELFVWTPDWLPYRVLLPILGGLALNRKLHVNSDEIKKWYWGCILAGRYDVASNTRAVEDYARLEQGAPDASRSITLARDTFYAVNRRQYGALHRGILALIAANGPLDPAQSQEPVTVSESLESSSEGPHTVSYISSSVEKWGVRGDYLTLGLLITARKPGRGENVIDLDELNTAVLLSQALPGDSPELSIEQCFESRLESLARTLALISGFEVHLVDEPAVD